MASWRYWDRYCWVGLGSEEGPCGVGVGETFEAGISSGLCTGRDGLDDGRHVPRAVRLLEGDRLVQLGRRVGNSAGAVGGVGGSREQGTFDTGRPRSSNSLFSLWHTAGKSRRALHCFDGFLCV